MNTAQNVGTSNALILMILLYSFVFPLGDSFLWCFSIMAVVQ